MQPGSALPALCRSLSLGFFDALAGARAAFLFGAAAAAVAFVIAATIMPGTLPRRTSPGGALLDFRPVFRNSRAMAWIVGYTVHTWELAALRAWAVTFLAATFGRLGVSDWMPEPPMIFTCAGLAGVAISVTGNETAQRIGRNRVVLGAVTAAAHLVAWHRLDHRHLGNARRCLRRCVEHGDLFR